MRLALKRSAINLRHRQKAERVQRLFAALRFANICDSGFSRNALFTWFLLLGQPALAQDTTLGPAPGAGRRGLFDRRRPDRGR